ncbi:MFS general substrate transporter [Aspergillus tubingensis]|uniref:Polyamine transporter 4 n=1 Tax=Aspergillus niger TaxID=5061 RepID=A0A117E0U2_ASPNG|nr:MFS general substrate transporter [Aspergillus tubingensis]GAQ42993.1 polyamine transporter 4 [Aspergillus niger]GFN10902.1 MFS general substrate transporter [Aspergillus tubingensis]
MASAHELRRASHDERPLGSAMFAPGVTQVMEQFHSTSKPLSSFVVSVYLLGFAFGPLIVAPLSELYGRLPLYHGCNILFTLSNIAYALAPSMSSLISFPFLAGSAGSAPLALGAGTIADVMEPQRRGLAISVWATGPVVGPVVGPYVAPALYPAPVSSGICTGFSVLFLRETYAPILLSRKTKRLIRAGSTIGLLAMGRFSDVVSKHLAGGTKGPWKPEFRLALMIPLSLALPIGLLWYGWTAEKKAH